jgi:hypothetical protein
MEIQVRNSVKVDKVRRKYERKFGEEVIGEKIQ